MPKVFASDQFGSATFTVPPFNIVNGTPARDTTIVKPGEPASLLISYTGTNAEELVYPQVLGTPWGPPVSRFWRGYFFRQNTGEEPSSTHLVAQVFTSGFGFGVRTRYDPSTNSLTHQLGGDTVQSCVIALDTWHWIEEIVDVSGTTWTSFWRVNGVDQRSSSETSHSADTVDYHSLGRGETATSSYRFAHYMWGQPVSSSDWLGEPPGRGRINTFEGGTDETVVSTSNTGGASGFPFDVVVANTPATEPAFDSAQAFTLPLSMRCSQSAAAADFCLARWATLGESDNAYGRCYIYFTANPAATCSIAHTQTTAGGQLGRIRITTGGLVSIGNSAGTLVATSTTAINLNGWTRIEWRIRTDVPDFTVRIATNPKGQHVEELTAALDTGARYGRQEYGMSQVLGSGSLTYWMDGLVAGATYWPGVDD